MQTPDKPGGGTAGNRHRMMVLTLLLGGYTMLGPFSISTYMPFFPELAEGLSASADAVQQSLSAYLAAFGLMMLFHGPMSDAFGRRPVILIGLLVYVAASVGAALSTSIGLLVVFRVLQGLSAGAGSIVGRAIARDLFDGAEAQRLFSHITMVFAVAPAVAPVFGGWLHQAFPWQSVFTFLAVFALIQLVTSYFHLPESLAHNRRDSLRPAALVKRYLSVGRTAPFWLLTLALSGNFAAFFLYIAAAPVFVPSTLELRPNQFGWLFIPAMSGVMLGAFLSGRAARRLGPQRTVRMGYAVMAVAVALNVGYNLAEPPSVPWAIAPIAIYTTGMAMATPGITLLTLDLFSSMRGLVSSLQGFAQTMLMTLVSAFLAPALADSGAALAWGNAGLMAVGAAGWIAYEFAQRRQEQA
jgi:DHA1 family bicyclomycin/chloramphenicol resistance-like MFS transporter